MFPLHLDRAHQIPTIKKLIVIWIDGSRNFGVLELQNV
jgi:hypothetical protein